MQTLLKQQSCHFNQSTWSEILSSFIHSRKFGVIFHYSPLSTVLAAFKLLYLATASNLEGIINWGWSAHIQGTAVKQSSKCFKLHDLAYLFNVWHCVFEWCHDTLNPPGVWSKVSSYNQFSQKVFQFIFWWFTTWVLFFAFENH